MAPKNGRVWYSVEQCAVWSVQCSAVLCCVVLCGAVRYSAGHRPVPRTRPAAPRRLRTEARPRCRYLPARRCHVVPPSAHAGTHRPSPSACQGLHRPVRYESGGRCAERERERERERYQRAVSMVFDGKLRRRAGVCRKSIETKQWDQACTSVVWYSGIVCAQLWYGRDYVCTSVVQWDQPCTRVI